MEEYTERIKYYSDTPRGEKNKYFCFTCPVISIKEFLFTRISEGHTIRAAYYEKIRTTDQVILANKRINLNLITESYIDYLLNEKPFNSLDTFININLFNQCLKYSFH